MSKFSKFTAAEAAEIRHLGDVYGIRFDQASLMVAPVRVKVRAPSMAQLIQWAADRPGQGRGANVKTG
jgi:hypothetical protein